MNTLTLKAGLIALSVLTTSIASAEVVFSTDRSSYDFDAANTAGAEFVGYFTYNGTNYGVGANDFNFATAPTGFTRIATAQTVDGATKNVVYRFYNQAYSTVIGNIVQGDGSFEGRQFVKGVTGDVTSSSALTASTNYNYEGVVFNHIAGTEGDLDYTVSVASDGTVTGSGSISGVTGNRPNVGAFTLDGTLDTVTFTASNGQLNAATGNATLTLTDSLGDLALVDTKYDIGVYGPNANEVAGAIYTDPNSTASTDEQLQSLVSGYGIAGTLTSTTSN
ncbi:factor H binding protein domain-containing protein [Acinetobacter populi]|uniref:Factor H binding protein-like C-terminal domain-containing protein n=1 Tax=Acinetobacter populi TaxID=1582270 RepID=A0A1Z9YVS5_9GAMM|nr:factor H binding protein domain-containing protein [Acinetobacter populi]OUY06356.1 hypothetical protein CAP51_13960 [Acinetobacter populi]